MCESCRSAQLPRDSTVKQKPRSTSHAGHWVASCFLPGQTVPQQIPPRATVLAGKQKRLFQINSQKRGCWVGGQALGKPAPILPNHPARGRADLTAAHGGLGSRASQGEREPGRHRAAGWAGLKIRRVCLPPPPPRGPLLPSSPGSGSFLFCVCSAHPLLQGSPPGQAAVPPALTPTHRDPLLREVQPQPLPLPPAKTAALHKALTSSGPISAFAKAWVRAMATFGVCHSLGSGFVCLFTPYSFGEHLPSEPSARPV